MLEPLVNISEVELVDTSMPNLEGPSQERELLTVLFLIVVWLNPLVNDVDQTVEWPQILVDIYDGCRELRPQDLISLCYQRIQF